MESAVPLAPVEVTIIEPEDMIVLHGNRLTISTAVSTLSELHQRIETLYFVVPMLLSLDLSDPLVVERVEGTLGGIPFQWELVEWSLPIRITTQEYQERALAEGWASINVVGEPSRRRLLAAIHFLHTARRLLVAGATPWEFMAEALVNFAKILEVLFPAGTAGSMDAAREGLKALGYGEDEIEGDFIPAIALRNHLDGGHPTLKLFTRSQLTTIHDYTERAEGTFQTFLVKLVQGAGRGEVDIAPGEATGAGPDELRLLQRLERYAKKRDAKANPS